MRCLFCDKKLSLLKLAKGDSFCTPEHFDAYQLKMSKTDIERLMGLPVADTPKSPLVPLSREEAAKSVEQEAGPGDSRREMEPPPPASFAKPALPSFPLQAVLLGGETVANVQDETPRSVALPVHEVAVTAGVVNLYRQLNPTEMFPLDWAAGYPVIFPEEFRPAIVKPSLGLGPVTELEDLPASEPVPAVEPASGEAKATKGPSLPFLISPLFGERAGTTGVSCGEERSVPSCVSLTPHLFLGKFTTTDSPGPIERFTSFAGAPVLGLRESPVKQVEICSDFPGGADFFLPGPRGDAPGTKWRVSSGPMEIVRNVLEMRLSSTSSVDFSLPGPDSLLVRPDAILPQRQDPARILSEHPPVSFTLAPEENEAAAVPGLPRPLDPERVSPLTPGAGKSGKRALEKGSPLRSGVERPPAGRVAPFTNRPARAIEFICRTLLAKEPPRELFSTVHWSNQTLPFALRPPIAEGLIATGFALEALPVAPACVLAEPAQASRPSLADGGFGAIAWEEADCAPAPAARPKALVVRTNLRFSAAHGISSKPQMAAGTALGLEWQRTSVAAPVLFAETGLPYAFSAQLPKCAAGAHDTPRMEIGSLWLSWEPRVPVSPVQRLAKFLPFRGGPIFPAARSWPRLGALPR